MLYASINTIFQLVNRYAAKNEQGFISVSDFNFYAPNAQQRLFQEVLSQYRMFLGNRQRYLTYWKNNYDSLEAIKDDLRTLQVDRVTLNPTTAPNIFAFPNDYSYYINLEVSNVPVTIIDNSFRNYYLQSRDAKPSATFPIGLLGQKDIEIFPETIEEGVKLSYYKFPQGVTTAGVKTTRLPTFAYTVVNGKELYNSTNSIDFELPKHLESRLAAIILSDIGIEIREADLLALNQAPQNEQ